MIAVIQRLSVVGGLTNEETKMKAIYRRLEGKMTNSVEIKVGINTEISESTANGCLKIVEMFLNQHPDMTVVPCRYPDGELCLELVEEEDEHNCEENRIEPAQKLIEKRAVLLLVGSFRLFLCQILFGAGLYPVKNTFNTGQL